ncbi:Uncharacterized protein BP5553_10193 [Venustampulla echinocandica]|uniref:Uncharacterized protein n=1 Tax=Venustampulla echinocandica TaxID=2656787 RepID=A0A370TAL5_9HELO|nr:Uncharacterized protein BP5553_10193 [Venustampulla echinocandica]RDL30848.1 Uncharacterized protein BP5553_10193 [Venustampulla echinocandica]
MSGSAAPKSKKKDKQIFEPDFKAKEIMETDNTWFQQRFGTNTDDKTEAGATGKASKSDPKRKTGGSKCVAS